ncbi:MAG: NADH-quinone oxidoreductase subunit N [Bacteroidota bacterium]|nr:NADH-quinone oxidoreductase subunit N [Bacteroidota bacterium]
MNTFIALASLGVITMFLGVLNLKKWLLPFIVAGLAVTIAVILPSWNNPGNTFLDMFYIDNFFVLFSALMVVSTLVVFLMAAQYYKGEKRSLEGIYSIIIFSLFGGIMMVSAGNMIMFFTGLEIMSISLYLLAGSHKTSYESNEAAMKYFLMGAFASAFLLFGIALLYGATGSLYFTDISSKIAAFHGQVPSLLKAGILLVAIGMAFKVAAAPFHFWAPDVYHGSPTLITAYMITVIKVAGFAAFLRLTMLCFGSDTSLWVNSVAAISAISIVLGNFSALTQSKSKRMLAYSSVAHSGYILIALVSIQTITPTIIAYYSAAYVAANLAAFIVIIMVKQTTGSSDFESFNGIAKTNPVVAACGAIAMLSLTGIPPLAGFMGKYFVFSSAIQQGYLWLVLIAIVGSAVSIFYYFRPVINMYMKDAAYETLKTSKLSIGILVMLTILTVILGLIPGLIINL